MGAPDPGFGRNETEELLWGRLRSPGFSGKNETGGASSGVPAPQSQIWCVKRQKRSLQFTNFEECERDSLQFRAPLNQRCGSEVGEVGVCKVGAPGPAAPAPATPPADSLPATAPCPGPHRSPGVRPGVRVAAPAAAAAACRSALVSNSLHGYSLYGGGGGGAGRSSSGSRRSLARPPARSARPHLAPARLSLQQPSRGGALRPATVTRLHAPPPQRPAHARLQRPRRGRALSPLALWCLSVMKG